MHALHPAFFRTSASGILSCHLFLKAFSNSLCGNSLVSLHDSPCPHAYTCIQKGWRYMYHSLVGVKLDSISLPDICTESSECHTGFCNSGSDLIINVHCSVHGASHVGEFINNFQFLSIHSDRWFIVRLSM